MASESYWHQVGEQPLLYKTLGQLVGHAAQTYGDHEALVQEGVRLSFRRLKDWADELAAGLLHLGLVRGDRVAIWAGNSLKWVVAKLAVARAGLISVDLNPQYRESELTHCLRLTGASAVVMGVENRGVRLHDVLCTVVPELRQCSGGAVRSETLPRLKVVVSMSDSPLPGALTFDNILLSTPMDNAKQIEKDQTRISPDSIACIQMSSGTTGKPKAILITHRGAVNNSFLTGKRLGLHKSHRVCLQVPLFHAFGTVIALFPAVHFGATSVLPAAAFSAHRSLEALRLERCSVLMGTPTMYVDLARLAREKAVKVSVEVAMIAGAPITPQLAKHMVSDLGVKRISNGYGLSEVSALVFLGKEGDSVDCMVQTVGSVTEHAEVKVVDEKGDMVPFGTPGELLIRGYLVMDSYFNDPEATAKAMQHNWFRTGDKFVLESNGYGRIQGRIKDMILRGGENIYPKEVEDVVADHPDVLEAEVVGVVDERLGEEVCACVRLRQGVSALSADELRNFCRPKMAAYKLPRYCLVTEDFPRTLSGKIQKYVLRELCAEALQSGKLNDGTPGFP